MNTLPVRRQYSDGYRTENSLSTNIQVKKRSKYRRSWPTYQEKIYKPWMLADIPGKTINIPEMSINIGEKATVFPGISIGFSEKAIDIGRKAIDIGEKAIDIGRKTIDIGEKAIDIGRKTIDIGEKAIDIGRKTIGIREKPVALALVCNEGYLSDYLKEFIWINIFSVM